MKRGTLDGFTPQHFLASEIPEVKLKLARDERQSHKLCMLESARGFTLIELLVVIAIIGVLSAVVLSSLNSARTKGRDAAILSNMDSASPQAVLYEDTNHTYGTSLNDCTVGVFSDAKIQSILTAVALQNNAAAPVCYAADSTYALALQRPTGTGFTPPTVYWCVDASGKKCGINDTSALSSTGLCGCP